MDKIEYQIYGHSCGAYFALLVYLPGPFYARPFLNLGGFVCLPWSLLLLLVDHEMFFWVYWVY